MIRRRYDVNRILLNLEYKYEPESQDPLLRKGYYSHEIIPATTIMGTRKVKNFTCTFYKLPTEDYKHGDNPQDEILVATYNDIWPVHWCIYYLPEGSTFQNLNFGDGQTSLSFVEPNQNVIMSGIIGDHDGVARFTSKLSRNLNSGDSVGLIMAPSNVQIAEGAQWKEIQMKLLIEFAVTY